MTFFVSVSVPRITQADLDAIRKINPFIDKVTKLHLIDDSATAEKFARERAQSIIETHETVVSVEEQSSSDKLWSFTFKAMGD
jgi:SOS response regulatory protein OraA/RecX